MLTALRYWRAARSIAGLSAATLLLGACSMAGIPAFKPGKPQAVAVAATSQAETGAAASETAYLPLAFAPPQSRVSGSVDGLIAKYAAVYGVPESLIRRVVAEGERLQPQGPQRPVSGADADPARYRPLHGLFAAAPRACSMPRPTSNTRSSTCAAPTWSAAATPTPPCATTSAATTTTPGAWACSTKSGSEAAGSSAPDRIEAERS